ncbi:DUF2442 domain-containing protein [Duganella fentianensis]|uniref:DUF2442 domain-containing protein n=1 Tax=Duganella fentianensis TaxID=2692177 RepID=UPI0032B24376
MNTFTLGERIQHVAISATHLIVRLADGRQISTPLEWYPRLAGASRAQLDQWEIIGDGEGLHWPLCDEDLSLSGMLRGVRAPA